MAFFSIFFFLFFFVRRFGCGGRRGLRSNQRLLLFSKLYRRCHQLIWQPELAPRRCTRASRNASQPLARCTLTLTYASCA